MTSPQRQVQSGSTILHERVRRRYKPYYYQYDCEINHNANDSFNGRFPGKTSVNRFKVPVISSSPPTI